MGNKNPMLSIYSVGFMNTFCSSLLIAVLPQTIRNLGFSDIFYGICLSVFSFTQFFSTPLLGEMSDDIGRRKLLLLCQIGTFFSWIIFAMAYFSDKIWLFPSALVLIIIIIARAFDGITGGNYSIANAYIIDISDKNQTIKRFANVGAIAGIGLILGSAIGNLSNSSGIGYLGTALVALTISLIAFLFTYFFLPETKQKVRKFIFNTQILRKINVFARMKSLRLNSFVKSLLAVRFFTSVGGFAYMAVIILQVLDVFQFNSSQLSIFLFFVGSFVIINQFFVVKKLIKLFGQKKSVLIGLFLSFTGVLLIGTTTNLVIFIVFEYLFNLGFSIITTILKNLISENTSAEIQGEAMGVDDAFNALGKIVAPFFGTLTYQYFNSQSFAVFAIVVLVSIIIYIKALIKLKNTSSA
jgi:MFS family permease